VKLLDGSTVDIETYGEGKIILWHLLWIIAGVAWILYWFAKRGLVSRFAWVASGKAEELITPRERMVGALTLVAVLLVVIIFYAITVSNYPNTIPLQAGDFRNIQAIENGVNSGPITIEYVNGTGLPSMPLREFCCQ
jgi:methane/ammonia monooxygenase subunit B